MNRVALLFCLVALAAARRSLRDPAVHKRSDYRNEYLESLVSENAACTAQTVIDNVTYPWDTHYFNVKLDHFTYSDTRTFPMKYLINNCYYKPGGPIFFYTGNEGDIEGFATATGIMWDLAPQFGAAIIFAEHRFYGATQPFADKSYDSINNMGYLDAEQALADYADFLIQLKTANNNLPVSYPTNTSVVAFGGSYGGMLAAWFRMKYPHLVVGAWASSAPLLYVLNGGVDVGTFDRITTRTYNNSGCNPYILFNWWPAILRLSNTTDGQNFINTNMNLNVNTTVHSVNDGWNLVNFIREGIEYMAMVDYPYPSNFLGQLPGDPTKVACLSMNAPGTNFTDQDLAMMAYNASQVYYNTDQQNIPYCIDPSKCGDPATASLGDAMGWPWQECSEIVMAMCAQGAPNDMFWNECGNSTDDMIADLAAGCVSMFGDQGWNQSVWNLRAVETRFGLTMSGHTNIILTQGYLDPWSGGGYSSHAPGVGENYGIYVMDIQGSAHHLDLRQPNTCDPNTVTYMRYQIVRMLQHFIANDGSKAPLYQLPPLQPRTIPDDKCVEIVQGYPWGQTDVPVTQAPPVVPTTQKKSTGTLLTTLAVVAGALRML